MVDRRNLGQQALREFRNYVVPVCWRPPLLVSSLYIFFSRLLELIVLLARGDRGMEIEVLVLRDELSILRRPVGQPRFEPHDRLVLAALSRHRRADPQARGPLRQWRYGVFKEEVGEAVVALLEPIRTRYEELRADSAELERLLAQRRQGREASAPTLEQMYERMGFARRGRF